MPIKDRFITVAIHTYDRAVELKNYLESEGVEVFLQNVNLTNPVVSSGIRVRIHENDLPKALRLIENVEIFTPHIPDAVTRNKRIILVPTDFSDMSNKACEFAFSVAEQSKSDIVLLHSFVEPGLDTAIQLSDNLEYDVMESEIRESLATEAEKKMSSFSESLKGMIKEGLLPTIKYSRKIVEGIPEDSINEFAKQFSPYLIVMGTRGKEKKERELIGSITAEVLDTCRSPIFTLPDTIDLKSVKNITQIAQFCSLDQSDMIAIDALVRFFKENNPSITLTVISTKKDPSEDNLAAETLTDYCKKNYPDLIFSYKIFPIKTINDDFGNFLRESHINLIAVPNKKKNVFARLFNPGLAHRLLFRTDTPMIVLPV